MTDIHPMLEQRRAERRALDHYSHEFKAAMFDELLAFIVRWTHDGHLQTFEDRERFRVEARAVLAKCRGQS